MQLSETMDALATFVLGTKELIKGLKEACCICTSLLPRQDGTIQSSPQVSAWLPAQKQISTWILKISPELGIPRNLYTDYCRVV